MYDIIIIGAGAAGMSAAIYAGRGEMKTLVLESISAGGQMNLTYEVDNYPGFSNTPGGSELSEKMKEHAKIFGAEFKTETVLEIENFDKQIKTVKTRRNSYETKAVIFATGANPKKSGAVGEDRFYGMGVSYCATCDGAFFKGQDTCVIGGGNTAFEDALYLARFSKSVTLIHRRDTFRANASIVTKVKENSKIKILTDTIVTEIKGDTTVSDIITRNTKTGKEEKISISGVFVAVGTEANTKLAAHYVKLNEQGFIVTDRYMQTNVKGIYAAGDVRDTPLRQIVTAASDGAVAAVNAINYINGQEGIN